MSIKRRTGKHKVFAITFDDGPGTRLTPRILDLLAKYDTKATFFLLGRNITGRELIVRKIFDEGHEIASHGYDHLNYWKIWPICSIADIKRGRKAIDSVLNADIGRYAFRPPYGKLNLVSLLYLLLRRIHILNWTHDMGDTWTLRQRTKSKPDEFLDSMRGGVVLIHDFDRDDESVDRMVLQSLCDVLQKGKQVGARFVTCSQLKNLGN